MIPSWDLEARRIGSSQDDDVSLNLIKKENRSS